MIACMAYRTGFIALIGRPNVGKSTLLNTYVGQKVSIVSDKPQTTRRKLLGILTTDAFQAIFVDTPGVHEARTHLGKLMNDAATQALYAIDLVLVVVDASRKPSQEDEYVAQMLRRANEKRAPVLLCLNKMDLLKPERVVANTEEYCALYGTEEYMLTSFSKGYNTDLLLAQVVEKLPEGEPIFPEDEITDQPMRFLAAELIREKALEATRQEVPHAIATHVDAWEEQEGRAQVAASIVVEKEGQKAILIGRGGSMLKKLGAESRKELEAILGKSVYLELFVKVRPEWRQNPRMLHDLELTD